MNDVVKLARALDFAARKHTHQRRKGEAGEPYINHLAEVALLLAEASGGQDVNLVTAGLLHDCIEDQGVAPAELAERFGDDVTGLVLEVTDDKCLEKAERKRLQITETPHRTERAKMLKIADKTANLRSIASSPPQGWSAVRRREYFEWARAVVAGCGDVNAFLTARFEEAYRAGGS